MSLTDKQKRFCEEYLVDLNATQAAIRAGYSEKTARSIANENLTKPDIQNYIQELQKEISDRNKITVDECVSLLSNLARFDIAECYDEHGSIKDIHSIPKEHRLAIEAMETEELFADKNIIGHIKKLKTGNRKTAIDMLMKHLGGYEKDNSQKSANITLFELPDNGRDQ